ncbi:MAG: hypothetical protein E8A46_04140 [Bradyrhizobium sp.]|nr:MAG: hypothetical protein E8A46_04140 [Bradyrhizobium sp.]
MFWGIETRFCRTTLQITRGAGSIRAAAADPEQAPADPDYVRSSACRKGAGHRRAFAVDADPPKQRPPRGGRCGIGPKRQAFRNASRSALMVAASVVGMPCGKPL